MKLTEKILESIAGKWKAPPVIINTTSKPKEPNSMEFNLDYALNKQYLLKFKNGFPYDIMGKKILEIGCGQGGISTFLAVNGASYVIGTDINTFHLEVADQFKNKIQNELKIDLSDRLLFKVEDAYNMSFEESSFDIIIADNVFEHFMQPEKVLGECQRILKPGGLVIIPNFNSIYSKYGAHLKYGLKLPWVNLFFSEKTICRTLFNMAQKNPQLKKAYPGISPTTTKIKDLRAYQDLNSMTFKKFSEMAHANGFKIASFVISPPFKKFKFLFSSMYRVQYLKFGRLSDIFSIGVSCVLTKVNSK
ncbi:MAG: class I SAM-dependent methyltransferase [Ferruginibacter sp.]|nr:class I SAM-dependent methyltransferase [Ferruginibacter sp.]